MFAEMPMASLYLMIVGGLATVAAMAVLRREWSWVLALGLPLLFAMERAGMPPAIFAWGCALYAIALPAIAAIWAVRRIGPIGVGLAGALAFAGLSSMPAAAARTDFASLSWHQPPAFGVRLAAMLGQLADDPRYAAD